MLSHGRGLSVYVSLYGLPNMLVPRTTRMKAMILPALSCIPGIWGAFYIFGWERAPRLDSGEFLAPIGLVVVAVVISVLSLVLFGRLNPRKQG